VDEQTIAQVGENDTPSNAPQGNLDLTASTVDAEGSANPRHLPTSSDPAPVPPVASPITPTPPAPTAEAPEANVEAEAPEAEAGAPLDPPIAQEAKTPEGAGDSTPELAIVEKKRNAAELLERLNELEGRLAVSEAREKDAQTKERARMESMRADLLVNTWKLRKDVYAQLAPTVDEADPTSDEGKEKLRQWAVENKALFAAAPELPSGETYAPQETRFGERKRWRDIWK